MNGSLGRQFLRKLRLKESWIIFFILGLIMMNYPFIAIFNKNVDIAGIPLLFLYLEYGWLISICVIYLFAKAFSIHHDDPPPGDHH